jgi:benzoate transport
MSTDPRLTLARSVMTIKQVLAVGVCVLLNALDGYDVLSISFASPGIIQDWGIDRAALGVVLSFELFGMAAGSVVLGQMADRIGRRSTTIACLLLMSLGMLATTQVNSIGALALTRIGTGLGIGGMLVTTNAMVAEFSNDRWRSTAVAIMAAGYPLGAIVGGSIASMLLVSNSWHSVFYLGAGMTAALLPIVLVFVPEPVGSLLQRRPADVQDAVNATLRQLGHAPVQDLPGPDPVVLKPRLSALFSTSLARLTVLLTTAYFFHIMTFYFILKWVPKIVVDMGFAASTAVGVLVWANIGGLLGGLVFSFFYLRFSLRAMLTLAMVGSVLFVTLFGQTSADLFRLSFAAAVAGFFTNGGVVGIYALVAASFPTAVRAGGTGFVIGFGRGGAAVAPIAAGLLFQAGLSLSVVAAVMALGSLIACGAILAMPRRETRFNA